MILYRPHDLSWSVFDTSVPITRACCIRGMCTVRIALIRKLNCRKELITENGPRKLRFENIIKTKYEIRVNINKFHDETRNKNIRN